MCNKNKKNSGHQLLTVDGYRNNHIVTLNNDVYIQDRHLTDMYVNLSLLRYSSVYWVHSCITCTPFWPENVWKNMQLDVKCIYFHEINWSVAKWVVNGSRHSRDVARLLGDNLDGKLHHQNGKIYLANRTWHWLHTHDIHTKVCWRWTVCIISLTLHVYHLC